MDYLIDFLLRNEVATQLYEGLFLNSSAESLKADIKPTHIEVASYGTFCIGVNASQYIRKRSLFGRGKPDESGAEFFSDCVLKHLVGSVGSLAHDKYLFYLRYEDQIAARSHPFMKLSTLTPDLAGFQSDFIDYKFRVQVFATSLAEVIRKSIPEPRNVLAADFLPFGRQMAEKTADIARERFP